MKVEVGAGDLFEVRSGSLLHLLPTFNFQLVFKLTMLSITHYAGCDNFLSSNNFRSGVKVIK